MVMSGQVPTSKAATGIEVSTYRFASSTHSSATECQQESFYNKINNLNIRSYPQLVKGNRLLNQCFHQTRAYNSLYLTSTDALIQQLYLSKKLA